MPLRESIQALVTSAPPDATVPVRWLAELLAAESMPATPKVERDVSVDQTVLGVAERFGKAPSTVRTWLLRGELPGAYRMHGREWRIPQAAVEALQRAQAETHSQKAPSTAPPPARAAGDLAEWRNHLPARATGT